MAIQNSFPAFKPTLLLDFAKTKRLDPRITFARTTTATYYDGDTVAKAEENLLLQSQDFTTSWTLFNVTASANTVAAPDGTTTADTLTETTATNFHLAGQAGSVTASTPSTVSIFAKANTAQYLQILVNNSSGHYISVIANLTSGAITQTNNSTATLDSSSITSVGGGWYRVVGSFTFANTTGLSVYFGMSNSATPTLGGFGVISYTGNAANNFYLWGAQLEQRSSVTAYTATTTQPITNYIPVLLTAPAGAARFNHNPVTEESLGLLIEEQRTNLLTYSADFSNAAWTKTRSSITSNTIVAPDGTLTGDKLVEDTTATNTHIVYSGNYVATSTTLTTSVYAKAAERPSVYLEISNFLNDAAFATFNLTTGVVSNFASGSIDYTNVSASIQSVGNGWYRCILTATKGTANSSNFVVINLDNGTTRTYTGNGYSGIYIWGAQLEVGAFPTSYIPTVAATVTRNADAASMTGSNFTSWYNAAEGAIYCESQTASLAQNQGIWAIGNPSLSFGSGNMMYAIYDSGVSGRILINSYTNGSPQVSNMGVVVSQTVNTFSKSAYAYKVNDFAQTTNAASVFADTSGTVPIGPTGLSIGNSTQGWSGASNPVNGTIKKLAYYPLRVTNAQLQALTS